MNALNRIWHVNALSVVFVLAVSVCFATPSQAQSKPLSLYETDEAPDMWKDIPKADWTLRAITALQSAGFVVGYPNGYFSGRQVLTRYEAAVAIQRTLKLDNAKLNTMPADLSGALKCLWEEFKVELESLEQPNRSKRLDRLMSFDTASPIVLGNYLEKSWPALRSDPPAGNPTLFRSFRLWPYVRTRVKSCVGGFLE